VNRLFTRQRVQATLASGEVDLDALEKLVVAAYEQADRDQKRTDRSISLMIEELDGLNRSLERQVEDRTAALRDREARLARQNLLIDAAINNMPHGLMMFDADGKVMICNQSYLDLYPGVAGALKPGMALTELLELRAAAGSFAGDPAAHTQQVIERVAKGEIYRYLTELPDGRTISVVNRPMPGGGWVVTHEDVTERQRAERQIAHMAHHDALSVLPNRLLFGKRLAEAAASRAEGEKLAVFYLDLDNFKTINDTLGHDLGDALLECVAKRLRGCVDSNATVARVGGDEFAIILPSIAAASEAETLAARIGEALREPCSFGGRVLSTDASIGIAVAPDDGDNPEELLKNADTALYRAKANGRATYRLYAPEMDATLKARRTMEIELRQALSDGQFLLHYQPILDLADNRISCCEALVRWRHPQRGLIPPGDFIPVAEQIGLIVQIGEWVLRKACADAAGWPDGVKVAVNLSPIQMGSANLVPTVVNALAASGLPACRLELEITESVMMQNTDATLAALHRLRELGVKISLDDFGTGFSALSYLRKFPFDKLKIDRAFIADLTRDDDALAIVRAVTSMTKSLRMITTAEGVETAEQLERVRMLGCDEVQGFFISRPQPVEAMIAVIAQYAPRLRAAAAG
jgi:diguanylate cyclase (GGDEF)-like protein